MIRYIDTKIFNYTIGLLLILYLRIKINDNIFISLVDLTKLLYQIELKIIIGHI
jgi:hypothetical protein